MRNSPKLIIKDRVSSNSKICVAGISKAKGKCHSQVEVGQYRQCSISSDNAMYPEKEIL